MVRYDLLLHNVELLWLQLLVNIAVQSVIYLVRMYIQENYSTLLPLGFWLFSRRELRQFFRIIQITTLKYEINTARIEASREGPRKNVPVAWLKLSLYMLFLMNMNIWNIYLNFGRKIKYKKDSRSYFHIVCS